MFHLQLAVREAEDGAFRPSLENGVPDLSLGEPEINERLSQGTDRRVGGGHTFEACENRSSQRHESGASRMSTQ